MSVAPPVAIVLAAGFGRRMQPLSNSVHKTLLTVGEKTIFERLVDGILASGVREIILVTGYRARELEEFARARYGDVRFTFVENPRYRETNNIYSMSLAFEHVPPGRDVLLVESDIVCSPEVFKRIIECEHPNVALVDRYRTGMDGTVVMLRDGVITDVIPSNRQHEGFSFADKYKTLNIYKFSGEFCATVFRSLLTYYANAIDDGIYYEQILGVLIYLKKATIAALALDGEPWAEVDDPNDLAGARFLFDPPSRGRILDAAKGGFWSFDLLDFHFLRNMHFPDASVLAELRSALPALLQNYGSGQRTLNDKLSFFLLCRPERVHALAGAAQVFPWLRRKFADRRALLPRPTFGEWTAAFPGASRYDDAFGVDRERVERLAADRDLVVFVTPNNPTGTVLESSWILEFARARPETLVLVDESFQGFCESPSLVSLLERDPVKNILVISSLSKTLGVPGARLGYAYTCDPALGSELHAELPIWNLGSVPEHLLELVLKHRDSLAASYERTRADREAFAAMLRRTRGVAQVHAGGGNFVVAGLTDGVPPGVAADRLLRMEKIYVKDVSDRIGDGRAWLRLAVRLPRENARLCEALERVTEPA